MKAKLKKHSDSCIQGLEFIEDPAILNPQEKKIIIPWVPEAERGKRDKTPPFLSSATPLGPPVPRVK